MRTLVRALTLLLAFAVPTAAQAPPDTVAVVAPGGLAYTAVVPSLDSVISPHNTMYKAQAAAENAARRLCLVTEVRLEGVTVLQLTPTCTLAAPGDSVIVDEPDDPAPDPEDPPVDDDEPDRPPQDPVEPGDTIPAPPDSTITYPEPADPSGAFFVVDWDYPQLHDGAAGRYPTTYSAANGHSRQVVLDQPGPWGGVHALRNTFLPMGRSDQPQVGTRVDFPATTPRLWLETWVRFSPNWDIGPTFRWRDNPDTPEDESALETGNTDHKTLFVFAKAPDRGPWDDWDRRWDIKFGPNFDDCVASGGQHPERRESFYIKGYFPPQAPTSWEAGQAVQSLRCVASRDVWDGQWHQLRAYMETYPTPTLKVWLDGRPMIDSDLFGTMRARPDHRFWTAWFGGNRNSGPLEVMWFEYGPALFWSSDPGW